MVGGHDLPIDPVFSKRFSKPSDSRRATIVNSGSVRSSRINTVQHLGVTRPIFVPSEKRHWKRILGTPKGPNREFHIPVTGAIIPCSVCVFNFAPGRVNGLLLSQMGVSSNSFLRPNSQISLYFSLLAGNLARERFAGDPTRRHKIFIFDDLR